MTVQCLIFPCIFVFSSGRYLVSGNQDGGVSVWDTSVAAEEQGEGDPVLPPILQYRAHSDTVNGARLVHIRLEGLSHK